MPQRYEKTALVVLRRAVFYEVLRKTRYHHPLFQPLSTLFASVLGGTVTGNIQRLGQDFVYIPFVAGTSNEPTQIAKDILDVLPDDVKSHGGYGAMLFCGNHEYGGQRFFYGYYYGNKGYASICYTDYVSPNITKVNKSNTTYTVFTINGTAV